MAVKIHPAILARTAKSYQNLIRTAERFGTKLHLDVMDGRFVKAISINQLAFKKLVIRRPAVVHFMVMHPEGWIGALMKHRIKDVIIPCELPYVASNIAAFSALKFRVALSINPGTPMTRITRWIPHIDGVHVLTVKPGRYHARFVPTALKTIKSLHRRYPRLKISCDGAVTPVTIPRLVSAGATTLGVGSFLMQSAHPEQSMQALRAALKQNMIH